MYVPPGSLIQGCFPCREAVAKEAALSKVRGVIFWMQIIRVKWGFAVQSPEGDRLLANLRALNG